MCLITVNKIKKKIEYYTIQKIFIMKLINVKLYNTNVSIVLYENNLTFLPFTSILYQLQLCHSRQWRLNLKNIMNVHNLYRCIIYYIHLNYNIVILRHNIIKYQKNISCLLILSINNFYYRRYPPIHFY